MKNFEWGQVFLLLIVAGFIWLGMLFFTNNVRTLEVPFRVEGLKKELAIANYLGTSRITLTGSNFALSRVTEDDLSAVLRLDSLQASGTYTIQPHYLVRGGNVRILASHPNSVSLKLAPAVSRSLPIKPLLTGWPADGFAVEKILFEPAQVEAYGAPEILDELDAAYVKFNLEGRLVSFIVPASVFIPDASGFSLSNVQLFPSTVKAAVQLGKNLSFKTVGVVPNLKGDLPPGHYVANIELVPSVITVKGSAEAIKNLDTLPTTPLVLNDHRESFHEKLAVQLPNLVKMEGPNLISAYIEIRSSSGSRQLAVYPQMKNLPQGLSMISINPAVVQVTVVGPPNILNSITKNDLSLFLDMRGTLSGPNTIKLTKLMFQVPAKVEIVDFTPTELSVQLMRNE